ncbi:hypothetical protein BJX63DRAFT_438663 [Aspergillus granulosus]|uniref:NmrA-like domain-containing protein n=1 Tax=Aspergillus granulosus TaxID=176169 RepID=A0ABR4GRC0_9EURO
MAPETGAGVDTGTTSATPNETSIENPTDAPVDAPIGTPIGPPVLSQRVLIVGIGTPDSNLILQVLNFDRQPEIIANSQLFSGSFGAIYRKVILTRPELWTEDDRRRAQVAMRQDIDEAETYTSHAQDEGKVFCASICATWLINPVVLSKAPVAPARTVTCWEAFKASVPTMYAGNHGFTYNVLNHTVLPDQYLRSWRMVFIITHPIVLFPYIYRSIHSPYVPQVNHRPTSSMYMTLSWVRMLYSWASLPTNVATVAPIIIDTGDLSIDTDQIVPRLSAELGLPLDLGVVPFDSLQAFREKDQLIEQNRTEAVNRLMAQGTSYIDACIQVVKLEWVREFGEFAANMIEQFARQAVPDYQYLFERRMKM